MTIPLYNVTGPDDLECISPITVGRRYSDPLASKWLAHTQVWKWNNGDAIVIPSTIGKCIVVIRVGDYVRVVECSCLVDAMRKSGLDPADYHAMGADWEIDSDSGSEGGI